MKKINQLYNFHMLYLECNYFVYNKVKPNNINNYLNLLCNYFVNNKVYTLKTQQIRYYSIMQYNR